MLPVQAPNSGADPTLLEARCVDELTHLLGPFLSKVVGKVVNVENLLVDYIEILFPDLVPLVTVPEDVRGITSGPFTVRVLAYVRVISFTNVL